MSKPFLPVDLSRFWNAGSENLKTAEGWLWPALEEDGESSALPGMPAGECRFWGLPFSLAPAEAAKRFVVVARNAGDAVPASATIALGQEARRVLFAHVCAPVRGERSTLEGTGEDIGAYRIVFADGSAVEQGLRRRFEIHDLAIPWGHHPSCAATAANTIPTPSIPAAAPMAGCRPVCAPITATISRDGGSSTGRIRSRTGPSRP